MPLNLIDQRLGKYRILDELGRGGMGVVYKAHDPILDRLVAIKVLAPQLTWDEEFVQRFLREARSAAGLRHPNIVTIHDVVQTKGYHFIVMDYLEGQPLAALLQRQGPISPRRAAHILDQVAQALDFAHARGLVHRDIKPANVVVDSRDHATLTDFGITRSAKGTQLTQSGVMIGTPAYMAPEQVQGQEVRPATDVYALGVMAYEMLGGRPPFQGDTPRMLHAHVYEQPPPLSQANKEIAPALEKVVHKALAKQPGQRYPSAGNFAAALKGALEAKGIQERSASRSSFPLPFDRGPAWVLAGVLGILLLVVVGLGISRFVGSGSTSVIQIVPDSQPTAVAISTRTITPSPGPGASGIFDVQVRTPTDTMVALKTPVTTPVVAMSNLATATLVPTIMQTATPISVSTQIGMVFVPAGNFIMGSEIGESDERPVHTVSLDAFWIDQYEVTNEDFKQFVAATEYRTEAEQEGWGQVWITGSWDRVDGANWRAPLGPGSRIEQIMDHPVVQVSWNDAVAYCNWAEKRLPTEAEWEKTARGDDGRIYPWGNEYDANTLNSVKTGTGSTKSVGSYEVGKSPYGAYDMAGNVWEWVADWYQSDYYYQSPVLNPSGPSHGTLRVLRGGAWDFSGGDSRSADRGALPPSARGNTVGFRCARNPEMTRVQSIVTPSPTPCPRKPGPTFGEMWSAQQLRTRLGCPVTDERGLTTAYQPFEHGFMVWRSDTNRIYVVYDDGTWEQFVDTWSEDQPDFSCPDALTPSRSPPTPHRGFGKVWCNEPLVRERLGVALEEEAGEWRLVQDFHNGMMLFIPERDTVYALLRDSKHWTAG